MAKKYSNEKDVTSYKWVKIIQSFLLIVFGVVLCAFSYSKDVQNALGYITASIILLYGVLTIGFGMIFVKGIMSIENVTGAALISLSALIFFYPQIVLEYIPIFASSMLIVFALIFLIDGFMSLFGQAKNKALAILLFLLAFIFVGLGITTLVLNYHNNSDQDIIRMILIILIGVILIIAGAFLIIYYGFNPKFKINKKEIISEDGTKKYTVIESERKVIKEDKPKRISKKDKKKAIPEIDMVDDNKKEEKEN